MVKIKFLEVKLQNTSKIHLPTRKYSEMYEVYWTNHLTCTSIVKIHVLYFCMFTYSNILGIRGTRRICHKLDSRSSQSCFEENTRWLTPSCILFKISTQYAFLQFSMRFRRFVHWKTRVNLVNQCYWFWFNGIGRHNSYTGMLTVNRKNIPVFSVILEFCNHLANVECQFFVNLLIWKKGY